MDHLQVTVPNWHDGLELLPVGLTVKTVDQVQEVVTVNAINPGLLFNLRHHYDSGQQPTGSWAERVKRSREFFKSFIDGTFDKYAHLVDFIEEFNEYFAGSQSEVERSWWIDQARAHAWVWQNDYRTQSKYAHIRLVLANTAVGNDIPRAMAQIYEEYYPTCVMGYHPYTWWGDKIRAANDWVDLSGRWQVMEDSWGIKVDWLFTECGPFESAVTGWRSPECLDHDIEAYVEAMREWLLDVMETPAYQEGRILGFNIFTTGRTGNIWKGFWTEQPELKALAQMISEVWKPVVKPPPKPDPECEGLPRVQYRREYWVMPKGISIEDVRVIQDEAFLDKITAGFSYDDAGIGALVDKTAVLYGISEETIQEFSDWYKEHYQGTKVEFRDLPSEEPKEFALTHWPTPHRNVSQDFGANPENYNTFCDQNGLCLPGHDGVDIAEPVDTPVFAAAPGKVYYVKHPSGHNYGLHERIEHPDGYKTIYAHLGIATVKEGDEVESGQIIGYVGITGRTGGPHLHFGMKKAPGLPGWPWDFINPEPFLAKVY